MPQIMPVRLDSWTTLPLTRVRRTWSPGDMIFSGTPANSRPVQPGDVVTVECEGLGVLENTIVEGSDPISDEAGWPPSASDKVLGVALGEQLRE